jgi:hypothetical protein
MTSSGPIADLIARRLTLTSRRLGVDQEPVELRTDLFRPQRASRRMEFLWLALEAGWRRLPTDAGADHPRDIRAALLGRRRQARHRRTVPGVGERRAADGEDVGQAAYRQTRRDIDAAGRVGLGTQPRRRWRSDDAGGPQDGARRDGPAVDHHAVVVDALDPAVEEHFDTELLQRLPGALREILGKGL